MTTSSIREMWARAIEPEPSVTITEETFFGHGWQPLTIIVLQAIWFLPPGEPFDVDELVAWFRALGWKSANGKPLGADAVRRELALIRKAGYVRAYRVQGEGGRMAGMRYEISKRPKAPQERIEVLRAESTKPQVTPCASNEGTWTADGRDKTENRRSHHVPPMTTHGGSPGMADEAKPQVTPCASIEGTWRGAPPTPPPEEVTTSSPNPLTGHADRSGPASRGEEAAEEFQPEAIAEAEEFLQELPAPWAVGRPTARRYAPLLVESACTQGWDLDDLLTRELTKGPLPRSPQAALKTRIKELVRRRRVSVPSQNTGPVAGESVPELPPYCGDLECDEISRMRSNEDERGYLFVEQCPKCHPVRMRQLSAAPQPRDRVRTSDGPCARRASRTPEVHSQRR